MSSITFPACTAFTRKAEGGWTVDAGGPTEKGITFKTFTAWRAATHSAVPTINDLKTISDAEWNAIAGSWYWNPVHGDGLPPGVDLSVFDMGFNAGPAHSAQILQSVVGVKPDGYIGPVTLKAVAAADPGALVKKLAVAQMDYYETLPGWSVSGHGWSNRVLSRQAAAMALAVGHGGQKSPTLSPADTLNQQQIEKGS